MVTITRAWKWLLRRWLVVTFSVVLLTGFLIYQQQDRQIAEGKKRTDRIEEVAKQVAANLVQAKIDTCNAAVLTRHDAADLLDDIIADAIKNTQLRDQIRNRIDAKLLPVPADCVRILEQASG